jgi:hypothetical protein
MFLPYTTTMQEVRKYPANKRKPPRPYQYPTIKAFNFVIDFPNCNMADENTVKYLKVIVPKKNYLPAINVFFGWQGKVLNLRLVAPKKEVRRLVASSPLPTGVSVETIINPKATK